MVLFSTRSFDRLKSSRTRQSAQNNENNTRDFHKIHFNYGMMRTDRKRWSFARHLPCL
jgi:hypothetical protein